MTAEYLAIYRIESGLIVEAWAEWNNLSGLIQLGHHSPVIDPELDKAAIFKLHQQYGQWRVTSVSWATFGSNA